jgi:alternate signal-mediated exported protein
MTGAKENQMKKTTKALCAAAAGFAMLATTGGFTFASWQDAREIATANVATGDLRLDFARQQETDPYKQVYWTLYGPKPAGGTDAQRPQVGPSGYGLVGMAKVQASYRLTGVVNVRTRLQGESLVATLTPKYGEPAAYTNYEGVRDWLERAAKTVKVTTTDPAANNAPITDTTLLYPTTQGTTSDGYHIYTVTITIDFPSDTPLALAGIEQTGDLYLGDLVLTLKQQAGATAYRG